MQPTLFDGLLRGRERFLVPAWTGSDIRRLRELYATHTAPQIARELGRSVSSVRTRCWMLGLKGKNPVHGWSAEETAAVRAAYTAAGGGCGSGRGWRRVVATREGGRT